MNGQPRPALVSRQAATRLPRAALLLFCAAYVLPGLFGREPWKNADIAAFGTMASIARGDSTWLAPQLAGLPADGGLLPYWIGAASIRLLPWLEAPLAARLPFALLLLAVLALTWYACYHLARTEAAQPLPFPFGGEADTVDYSRAVADGAVLALMATLGLLQLGHETTPEMVQLAAVALVLYALAASPYRGLQPKLAIVVGLASLSLSAAPAIALMLGLLGTWICARSAYAPTRQFVPWVAGATLLSVLLSSSLGAWAWRAHAHADWADAALTVRLFVWFAWPTLPLALWMLWRWRQHLTKRHVSVPLACAGVGMAASIAMSGHDRALLLAVPALAVLAAFALPTLKRSSSAAIDWFSVFFFCACAIAIWVIYIAMQTGVPAQPAANVRRLAPGFVASFSPWLLLPALAATLAWVWLVVWRTGRRRHPLWTSMVLPAAGVALCWTLLMTLWLPLLDHARSHQPLISRLTPHIEPGSCIWAPQAQRGFLAALEHYQREKVVGSSDPAAAAACKTRLVSVGRGGAGPVAVEAWHRITEARHPSDRENRVIVERRVRP
jgi:4-amino-4-deoxy-L-arabinose transferase-like glycosyltransferase